MSYDYKFGLPVNIEILAGFDRSGHPWPTLSPRARPAGMHTVKIVALNPQALSA